MLYFFDNSLLEEIAAVSLFFRLVTLVGIFYLLPGSNRGIIKLGLAVHSVWGIILDIDRLSEPPMFGILAEYPLRGLIYQIPLLTAVFIAIAASKRRGKVKGDAILQ